MKERESGSSAQLYFPLPLYNPPFGSRQRVVGGGRRGPYYNQYDTENPEVLLSCIFLCCCINHRFGAVDVSLVTAVAAAVTDPTMPTVLYLARRITMFQDCISGVACLISFCRCERVLQRYLKMVQIGCDTNVYV